MSSSPRETLNAIVHSPIGDSLEVGALRRYRKPLGRMSLWAGQRTMCPSRGVAIHVTGRRGWFWVTSRDRPGHFPGGGGVEARHVIRGGTALRWSPLASSGSVELVTRALRWRPSSPAGPWGQAEIFWLRTGTPESLGHSEEGYAPVDCYNCGK